MIFKVSPKLPQRVLYQPYSSMDQGPFKYIEHGYIEGFRRAGARIEIWDGRSVDRLNELLVRYSPDFFVGYLRRSGDYRNMAWMDSPYIGKLIEYRKTTGMRTALHAHPDVRPLVSRMSLIFEEDDPSSAGTFYSQPPPPTQTEEKLLQAGFIDVILHPYSRWVTEHCFGFWRDRGVHVMEEPLAADTSKYHRPIFSPRKSIDICYVGGWWPFKGRQLDRYLIPLSEKFGERLVVFGRNWPHLSRGPLGDEEFNRTVVRSKINLVFHEPSQVQAIPIHVNERIYKLYALGAFVICDNNACLAEYFTDEEIVLAKDPKDMVDKCGYYLSRPRERAQIASRGYRAVMRRHTYEVRAKTLLSFIGNMVRNK